MTLSAGLLLVGVEAGASIVIAAYWTKEEVSLFTGTEKILDSCSRDAPAERARLRAPLARRGYTD